MAVNAKLSQLSKMWKSAQSIQPSFSNVPEGDYVAQLVEMKLGEAKKSGRLQVISTYNIMDGEFEGKSVKRFDGLDNETSVGYFKGLCEVIGLDLPEDLSVLQEAMDEFVEQNNDLFNITIKMTEDKQTKQKYSNVYVNGISEFSLGEEGEGGEEGEEESEGEGEEGGEEFVEGEEGEGEGDGEGVEEVVEEQEVTPPIKKFAKQTVTKSPQKTVAKPVTKPVSKPVVSPPVKKIAVKR